MIKKCTCSHQYQDNLYGEKYRVFNARKDKGSRCTVCGKESVEVEKKKKVGK
jgi:hypothetical protein